VLLCLYIIIPFLIYFIIFFFKIIFLEVVYILLRNRLNVFYFEDEGIF